MSYNNENVEKLATALERLNAKENAIYFLTYDTRGNARASVKHIYDMALTLKEEGYNAKILVEDKSYGGVESWLGDVYSSLETVTIKDDRVEIKIEDIIVVPEYYSNALESLSSIRCVKIMLVQQKEYIFETLPIGSKWMDFGFDTAITTTEKSKDYIRSFFNQIPVYIIPPIIGDNFSPSEKQSKPIIAIACRDRSINKKLISEFYLKYPQLRWLTFRDMTQMSYEEFSEMLKECFVSVWVDDDSTFGTFPLESMKCGVPVIGKIPKNEPDWLSENGMWTYDEHKLVEVLGTYAMAWLDGVELTDEVKTNMKETLLPYNTETTKATIVRIFEIFIKNRKSAISDALEKFKTEVVS